MKRWADSLQHAGKLMAAVSTTQQTPALQDQYGGWISVMWWLLSGLKPETPPRAGSAEAKAWAGLQAPVQATFSHQVIPVRFMQTDFITSALIECASMQVCACAERAPSMYAVHQARCRESLSKLTGSQCGTAVCCLP